MIAFLSPSFLEIASLAILAALGFIIWLIKVSIPQIVEKKLSSVLGRADLVHRVQFETEFRGYTDTWGGAINTYRAFINAFPHPHFAPKTEEKYEEFVNAHKKFLDLFEGNRPFLPIDILSRIMVFDNLMVDAKTRSMDIESPEAIKANRKAVDEALKAFSEAIRERVSKLQIV